MRGFIKLPLRPDYENRPFQLVDELNGKPSVTRYELLGTELFNKGEAECMVTRVKFYPETGRTHQLRVHSAHHLGLRVPIMGDMLYGKKSNRLYLHAESLEFKHPVTGAFVRIKVSADY
jgi:tRNA pseudouridine32 synthase/23S rRNA pseudouridine746 synthase